MLFSKRRIGENLHCMWLKTDRTGGVGASTVHAHLGTKVCTSVDLFLGVTRADETSTIC